MEFDTLSESCGIGGGLKTFGFELHHTERNESKRKNVTIWWCVAATAAATPSKMR